MLKIIAHEVNQKRGVNASSPTNSKLTRKISSKKSAKIDVVKTVVN